MKLTDLYLSDWEIEGMVSGMPINATMVNTSKRIAKVSANQAVKKVVEDIQRVVDEAPFNYKIASVIKYLGELEKLVEELDKQVMPDDAIP